MALERDVVSWTNDNGKVVTIRVQQHDKAFYASFSGAKDGIHLDRNFTSQLDDAEERASEFLSDCSKVFELRLVEAAKPVEVKEVPAE